MGPITWWSVVRSLARAIRSPPCAPSTKRSPLHAPLDATMTARMKAEGGTRAREKSVRRAGRSSFRLHPASFASARVLVVGDAMLDRYWFGAVDRISPEAPVPIVRIDREEVRAGGAANVARNAAALGANVSLISVVGMDEAGDRLEGLLKRERVNAQLHRDRGIK